MISTIALDVRDIVLASPLLKAVLRHQRFTCLEGYLIDNEDHARGMITEDGSSRVLFLDWFFPFVFDNCPFCRSKPCLWVGAHLDKSTLRRHCEYDEYPVCVELVYQVHKQRLDKTLAPLCRVGRTGLVSGSSRGWDISHWIHWK